MMQSDVLVVGGAGYVGSHMAEMLFQSGFKPVVVDNLSTGYRDAVLNAEFIEGDIGDKNFLMHLFKQYAFSAVFHFAASTQIAESILIPEKCYQNNLTNTLNLLEVMLQYQVKHFIFSSTAAVYGEPQYVPIDIQHPKCPLSPYGKSKWVIEQVLQDYDQAYGLKSIVLRYFNAAGADPAGLLGERHEPETHLIPLVLQVAAGQRERIYIFGDDYETRDGTCIRDYVHVHDLCKAHLLAFGYLQDHHTSAVYNLGNGQGFSVKEVIHAAEQVTQKKIPFLVVPRRLGDPAQLIADASGAKQELGWKPQFEALTTIIQHAWYWQKQH